MEDAESCSWAYVYPKDIAADLSSFEVMERSGDTVWVIADTQEELDRMVEVLGVPMWQELV